MAGADAGARPEDWQGLSVAAELGIAGEVLEGVAEVEDDVPNVLAAGKVFVGHSSGPPVRVLLATLALVPTYACL